MQKYKKILVIATIISLVVANGSLKKASAGPLTNVSDTLSDSGVGAVATHVITLTTNTDLEAGDYYNVVLPAGFGNITVDNIVCPANSTSSAPSTSIARCTATDAIATGTVSINLNNVVNPLISDSYTIEVSTKDALHTVIELTRAMVAIIDHVITLTSVPATMTFEIRPLATTTNINGATTTMSSATTSIAYGELSPGVSKIAGQELRVITNATEGFSVMVEQDTNMSSNGGADIDGFKNGTTTSPEVWSQPAGTMDQEWSYGHFGFTSDDSNLTGGADTFGNNLWRGFASSTPVEVMYNGGPADGETQDKGLAKVGYQIEVSPLQEMGDYSNILTYILTPIY